MRLDLAATAIAVASLTITAHSQCVSDWQGTVQELEAAQQDAFSNFAGLLVIDRDPQRAFDLYVPGYVLRLSSMFCVLS